MEGAVATSVIDRSDCVASVTPAVALAELLAESESLLAPTVAVSVMMVPAEVPAFTFTTAEKFAAALTASVATLQLMVPVAPTAGVEQLHPTGEVSDTNVVFAGIGSLNVTVVADSVPWFVTACEKVTLLPAATAPGDPVFVSVTSALAAAPTVVAANCALFAEAGSAARELAAATFDRIVPSGTPAFTFATITNVALAPAARSGFVHVIVPVPPTGGVEQLHPLGAMIDWNPVFDGTVVANIAPPASLGPAFVTICVYVTFVPAVTGSGASVPVTLRSAIDAAVVVSVAVSLPR
jgi:hypothetical protein